MAVSIDNSVQHEIGGSPPARRTKKARSRQRQRQRDRGLTAVTVVSSAVVVVFLWWLIVRESHTPSYVVPSPVSVAQTLWKGLTVSPASSQSLLHQFGSTFEAAMIGLGVGGVIGVAIGAVAAQFRWLERLLMPYVFGFQTMPKVAIAPLLMIWFGFGQTSKAMLAGTLAFFPLVVNTFTGMNLVEREHLQLFTSLRASKMDFMLRLRLPGALPMVMAGLEIAIIQALLGAVVAEFIAGQSGIGTEIVLFEQTSNTSGIFAVLVILAVAGALLHAIVRYIHRRVVFWLPVESQGLG